MQGTGATHLAPPDVVASGRAAIVAHNEQQVEWAGRHIAEMAEVLPDDVLDVCRRLQEVVDEARGKQAIPIKLPSRSVLGVFGEVLEKRLPADSEASKAAHTLLWYCYELVCGRHPAA